MCSQSNLQYTIIKYPAVKNMTCTDAFQNIMKLNQSQL